MRSDPISRLHRLALASIASSKPSEKRVDHHVIPRACYSITDHPRPASRGAPPPGPCHEATGLRKRPHKNSRFMRHARPKLPNLLSPIIHPPPGRAAPTAGPGGRRVSRDDGRVFNTCVRATAAGRDTDTGLSGTVCFCSFFGQRGSHSNGPRRFLGIFLARVAFRSGVSCAKAMLFLTCWHYCQARSARRLEKISHSKGPVECAGRKGAVGRAGRRARPPKVSFLTRCSVQTIRRWYGYGGCFVCLSGRWDCLLFEIGQAISIVAANCLDSFIDRCFKK